MEENTPEVERTKHIEINAINEADAGRLENALSLFNDAIAVAPKRASLYNNRAQVFQLLMKPEGRQFDAIKFEKHMLELMKSTDIAHWV